MNWEEKSMQSKTSFYNRRIVHSDVRRFWGWWAVESLGLLLATIFPLALLMNRTRDTLRSYLRAAIFIMTNPVLIAIAGAVVAMLVFGDVQRRRAAYTIHSFPVRRETLFVSHMISGLSMVILPGIFIYLLLILLNLGLHSGMTQTLLLCMVESIVEACFFFSMAVLTQFLVGNTILGTVIFAVLQALYLAIRISAMSLGQLFAYSLINNWNFLDTNSRLSLWLTPVAYLWKNVGVSLTLNGKASVNLSMFWGVIGYSLAGTVLFLGLALLLYRRRNIECSGDMLAFRWCKPVFRCIFTICGSLLFAVMMTSLINLDGMLNEYAYTTRFLDVCIFVLIGVVLFHLIATMILERSFRVWKSLSPVEMAVMGILLFGGLLMVKTDSFGLGVPQADKIANILVSDTCGGQFWVTGQTQVSQMRDLCDEWTRQSQSLSQCEPLERARLRVAFCTKSGKSVVRNYTYRNAQGYHKKLENLLAGQAPEEVFLGTQPERSSILGVSRKTVEDDMDMSEHLEIKSASKANTALIQDVRNGAARLVFGEVDGQWQEETYAQEDGTLLEIRYRSIYAKQVDGLADDMDLDTWSPDGGRGASTVYVYYEDLEHSQLWLQLGSLSE